MTVGGDTLAQALDSLDFLSSRSITGNAAIEFLSALMSRVAAEDAKVIERIIEKDLKCGCSEATINKIWPGLIPTYPVMLASQYEQKLIDRVEWPAFVQLKMDGMRFNAIVQNEVCTFRSRNGKHIDIPSTLFGAPFIEMARHYGCNMVFDGELLAVDSSGVPLDRKTGNGIINKAVKGTMSEKEAASVRATIWDAIPLADFYVGSFDEPYRIRIAKLSNALSHMKHHQKQVGHLVEFVDHYEVPSLDRAQRLFEKFLSQGQEGIILKTKDSIWEDKRSKGQIKFKGEFECDLRIVGWEEGTGKNVGRLGALVCETEEGKLQCGLGTGFTDKDRDTIGREAVGKIVAVKYNAKITDKKTGIHSLFLPVFVEIREDKTTADSLSSLK